MSSKAAAPIPGVQPLPISLGPRIVGHSEGAAQRVAPSWGGPLTEGDYATLEASWITKEIAEQAILRRVDSIEGREIVCQKGKRDCTGILIPYYLPGEPRPHSYRIRRDNPDWTADKDGKPKQERKYLGAPGSTNRLYFPPGITSEQLADAAIPIVIVEGEKKALALQRLAYHEKESPRFIAIAVAGVWNWRGTVGKANGPRGERVDLSGPINDLNRIAWADRKVTVLFDVNIHTNDKVKWARRGLARELATRRAHVDFVNLPKDCGVNGVDDLLAVWGPARVLELFEQPVHAASLHVVPPPQFQSSPEGMFRIVTKGEQLTRTQLTNYQASVAAVIRLDDGVESKCEFEIVAVLMGRSSRFSIMSSKFAGMDWPIEQLGPQAITFPNQREYARAAIQTCSLAAEERSIYTHSGWRKVNGLWVFLHAGGAIGSEGAVPGVDVRLPAALARYHLPLPLTSEAQMRAVRSSLRLVELGSPSICFPVVAAACRAVFGDADFALHLTGATGVFKSELAALLQQFFGAGMKRVNLPGSWSSTGNSIEVLCFHAKDALVVIDDFAPRGSATEVAKCHAAADRVFRAAGNRAARGRLDSTAKLRDVKPPRGLILSTGEEIPQGQSIRARLLILEISKGSVNPDRLTECQKNAEAGLYAEAMAAFLRWIAGRYDEVRATFERRRTELRQIALRNPAHARTPEIAAGLQAAFEIYLAFSVECDAITDELREQLTAQCWAAVCDAAAAQSKHQAASEPAARYVALVHASLSSGQAHFAARSGGCPDISPENCGWRRDAAGNWHPQGRCIGWVDGTHVYIEPTAAYEVVQIAGRNAGEALPISEQTLKKRLHEKGLLASTDQNRGTLTIRRTIANSGKEVLHFLRATILPQGIDEPDFDEAVND